MYAIQRKSGNYDREKNGSKLPKEKFGMYGSSLQTQRRKRKSVKII